MKILRDKTVLRFVMPTTIVTDGENVRIICGEDDRISLREEGLGAWGEQLLKRINGVLKREDLFLDLPSQIRESGEKLLDVLISERFLTVVSPTQGRREQRSFILEVLGDGPLAESLRRPSTANSETLRVLCQSNLDLFEAQSFSRECVSAGSTYMWVSYGAATRAYVSPIFIPEGPCLECLFESFRSLSPAPELYAALMNHGASQGTFATVSIPDYACGILCDLVLGKIKLFETDPMSVVPYRMHVLELSTLEISSAPVLLNPDCDRHAS